MGKYKPRWGAEYCIEDDSWTLSDDVKNEDKGKIIKQNISEYHEMTHLPQCVNINLVVVTFLKKSG